MYYQRLRHLHWHIEQIFMNAYMYLAMLGNQLLSSIFADYISILSKLRRNTADIKGFGWIIKIKRYFCSIKTIKI